MCALRHLFSAAAVLMFLGGCASLPDDLKEHTHETLCYHLDSLNPLPLLDFLTPQITILQLTLREIPRQVKGAVRREGGDLQESLLSLRFSRACCCCGSFVSLSVGHTGSSERGGRCWRRRR